MALTDLNQSPSGAAVGDVLGPTTSPTWSRSTRRPTPPIVQRADARDRQYIGIRRDGALVAVADVHVWSPRTGSAPGQRNDTPLGARSWARDRRPWPRCADACSRRRPCRAQRQGRQPRRDRRLTRLGFTPVADYSELVFESRSNRGVAEGGGRPPSRSTHTIATRTSPHRRNGSPPWRRSQFLTISVSSATSASSIAHRSRLRRRPGSCQRFQLLIGHAGELSNSSRRPPVPVIRSRVSGSSASSIFVAISGSISSMENRFLPREPPAHRGVRTGRPVSSRPCAACVSRSSRPAHDNALVCGCGEVWSSGASTDLRSRGMTVRRCYRRSRALVVREGRVSGRS